MYTSNKISEIIINPDLTLLEGLKRMDQIKRKLLLVLDQSRFIGMLSVGDIQRSIINSIDLNTPVSKIIRSDYIVADESNSIADIKKKMFSIKAEFMPVISKENLFKDVYFWEDLFGDKELVPVKQFNLPVVVMAGGFGTRLKPITNVLPKPLIPIGEKTMLEEIFDRFALHGCDRFFISVNFKADLIEYYLKSQNLPYDISYFKEDKPMGTAGSLTLLKNKINETFIVSNCDILIDQDYSEILDYHRKHKNEITIVAALKNYPIPYGIVESGDNGKLTDIKEKPELTFKINSGLYILEPSLLAEIPENDFFHITHLIDKVRNRGGNIGVFPISEKSWTDVGLIDEYIDILKEY